MPTPTTDFSIFDGQELVTYEPISAALVAGLSAVRRPLTQSQARNVERFVALEASDVVFQLDGVPLAETPVMAGDSLTDANGVTYSVLFIERQSLGNMAVAVCRPYSV